MSATDGSLPLAVRRGGALANAIGALASARFYVYLASTVLALIITYHLGKEMLWDTLDYHFYAGFSAIHDRSSVDYFAAAWQAYLNPYVYVPFYLLATSGLSALQVALILGAAQSGVFWLTYELAVAVAAGERAGNRLAIGIFAVALALANPILLVELGSSFSDITTTEVVLAGWLILISAVRAPSATRVVVAALILGTATGLKLTNAIFAIAAVPMLLFLPVKRRTLLRYAGLFAIALGAAFAIVAAPWAVRMAQHFGNPLFPLFNGIFKSPYFTTGRVADYRFIPLSFVAALELPFAICSPSAMVHVEWAAPDLRYAVLLVAAILSVAVWLRRSLRHTHLGATDVAPRTPVRSLAALGCGFLTAWTLWLLTTGNGRYFIPMACVAAVLAVALIFRLFADQAKARYYVLLTVFAVQFFQLHAGTEYRAALPWDGDPWFDVSMPAAIAKEPALYLSVGQQSNSFIVPYLAPGSGFVNLEGIYTIGADDPNGKRVAGLIARYSPRVRMLVRDSRIDAASEPVAGFIGNVNHALEPFGLRADTDKCLKIVVRGVTPPEVITTPRAAAVPPMLARTDNYTGYLVSCDLVPYHGDMTEVQNEERVANVALDHLEEACPTLFQPRGMATYFLGNRKDGYLFVRRYPNTDVAAWVSRDWVRFQRLIGGGQEQYAGPEKSWVKAPLKVACRRTSDGDYLKVLQPFN